MIRKTPTRRQLKIIASLTFALIAVSLLVFGCWRWQLKRSVNDRIASIKSKGLPTNGAELNTLYPAVHDAENSALVITQAVALLRNYSDARSNALVKFRPPPPGSSLTRDETELLAGYVKMNQAAIAKTKEGLKLVKSRYPLDLTLGYYAVLPHLGGLRNLGALFQYQGLLAADSARRTEAMDSILALLGLSRTLEEEPTLISELGRIKLVNMGRTVLERTLNVGGLDEQQLAILDRAFNIPGRTDGFTRGFIGELACGIPTYRMNFAQIAHLPMGEVSVGNSQNAGSATLTWLMRTSGLLDRDLRLFLGVMETNIQLAAKGPPKSLAVETVVVRAMVEAKRSRYMLSATLLSGLEKAFAFHAESVADVRLAKTALAVERFRLQNHRLPSNLGELSPNYIPDAPADPFDGQPLRYKRLSAGYVIYSIGRDRQDDDGKAKSSRTSQTDAYDLTFTVER